MKYAATRPYADPEKAARKLLKNASTIELAQDGRIYIELLMRHFYSNTTAVRLSMARGSPLLSSAVGSGSTNPEPYVKFMPAGALSSSRGRLVQHCHVETVARNLCQQVAGQPGGRAAHQAGGLA